MSFDESKKEDEFSEKKGRWRENDEGVYEFHPFEVRKPVLDHETAQQFDFKRIDKEWLVITETLRRSLLQDAELRKVRWHT